MEDYILKDDATKLNQKDCKKDSEITNYILHHAVTNVNKPKKFRWCKGEREITKQAFM